jgi:hypothetical protein
MFLHTLFFPDYLPLSDFSVLEKYQFSKKEEYRIIVPIEEKLVHVPIEDDTPIEIKEEKKKPETNSLFHVKNVQDELFWLVFVAIYGETEYFRNKYNYGKVEIQEKQKIAEKIQDPIFAKKMKWKWTKIQKIEMISDLTNRPQMPIAIMNAIAAYYECTFILVDRHKKVYLTYSGISDTFQKQEQDSLEKTYIIYVTSKTGKPGKEKKEYTLDMQPSIESLQKIQETYFALEHYERPLKAISNYKKIELDVISCKLGTVGVEGTTEEKSSKQEVYDRLRLFLADSAILFLQE